MARSRYQSMSAASTPSTRKVSRSTSFGPGKDSKGFLGQPTPSWSVQHTGVLSPNKDILRCTSQRRCQTPYTKTSSDQVAREIKSVLPYIPPRTPASRSLSSDASSSRSSGALVSEPLSAHRRSVSARSFVGARPPSVRPPRGPRSVQKAAATRTHTSHAEKYVDYVVPVHRESSIENDDLPVPRPPRTPRSISPSKSVKLAIPRRPTSTTFSPASKSHSTPSSASASAPRSRSVQKTTFKPAPKPVPRIPAPVFRDASSASSKRPVAVSSAKRPRLSALQPLTLADAITQGLAARANVQMQTNSSVEMFNTPKVHATVDSSADPDPDTSTRTDKASLQSVTIIRKQQESAKGENELALGPQSETPRGRMKKLDQAVSTSLGTNAAQMPVETRGRPRVCKKAAPSTLVPIPASVPAPIPMSIDPPAVLPISAPTPPSTSTPAIQHVGSAGDARGDPILSARKPRGRTKDSTKVPLRLPGSAAGAHVPEKRTNGRPKGSKNKVHSSTATVSAAPSAGSFTSAAFRDMLPACLSPSQISAVAMMRNYEKKTGEGGEEKKEQVRIQLGKRRAPDVPPFTPPSGWWLDPVSMSWRRSTVPVPASPACPQSTSAALLSQPALPVRSPASETPKKTGLVREYQTSGALYAALRAYTNERPPLSKSGLLRFAPPHAGEERLRFCGSWAVVRDPNMKVDETYLRSVADEVVRESAVSVRTDEGDVEFSSRGKMHVVRMPCACLAGTECGGQLRVSAVEEAGKGLVHGLRITVKIAH
ncbi:hypothetical protein AcW1_002919 [Taiwanofungus camphoratus]|nr:hypothetical protein AcW1_002919 [Antrodia cinnamomea]